MSENEKKRRKQSRLARQIIRLRSAFATFVPGYGARRLFKFEQRLGGQKPSGMHGQDIILAACDDKYFDMFAVGLVHSMNTRAETHALHLHFLKPSDATIAKADALRKQFSNVRLTYTTDQCLDAHKANAQKIYYAAARFVVAPFILEAGARRLLIVDVDSVMRTSPWPILSQMRDTSIGFVFRNSYREWQRILAGAVLFEADAEALLFSRRLARALLVNVARKQEYYVDQIVPHYLIQLANRHVRARIKSLPVSIMSLVYAEGAAFWTAKGGDKFSEEFAEGHVAQL